MLKRMISILLAIICVVVVTPTVVYATTFNIKGTDMSIYMDEEIWYVFTPDNIKDNPELEELGLDYEDMADLFETDGLCMDAALFYDDGTFTEMIISKNEVDTNIINLADYTDDEIAVIAQEVMAERNVDLYYICNTDYKYIAMEYTDSETGYYVWEFVTFINQSDYTITFQTNKPFSSNEYSEIESIIGSISFKIDKKETETTPEITNPTETEPTLPEPEESNKNTNDMSEIISKLTLFAAGSIVAAGITIVGIKIMKKRKRK